MNEKEESKSRAKKVIVAVQSIKENLECRICLDYYHEPVTIKCGHQFCRNCILRIAKNDNATCPFCNIKIQKRSIPKDYNLFLQSCVDMCRSLVQAIYDDTGYDVLNFHKKVKHTKESIPLNDKPSNCKIDEVSVTSARSKVNSLSSKRLTLRKKQVDNDIKTQSTSKNTLHRYLSNKSESASHQVVPPQEKVKSWLKNVSQEIDDEVVANYNLENVSPRTEKSNEEHKVAEKSPFTQLKESYESSQPKTYSRYTSGKSKESWASSSEEISKTSDTIKKNEEQKYKEVQMRLQEVEMDAKKKKSNQNLSENKLMKTSTSVPTAAHSDDYDWRRVKKVGKEMQVKTFKSLNVSVEKGSLSSIVLDDTVPYNSTNNDSKNVSVESNTNNSSSNNITILETKPKLTSNQVESTKNVMLQDYSYNKNNSLDSSGSCVAANTSLSCMNKSKVNEIIGIMPENNLNTPEKTRNISNIADYECTSNQLSPLKANIETAILQNELSGDELSMFDCKTVVNLQHSPSRKNKFSIKRKSKASSSSETNCSEFNTPEKIAELTNELHRNHLPERPKSKLSLRLSAIQTSEHLSSQTKSPAQSHTSSSKEDQSSTRPHIAFKKLGKICKRQKHIPFLHLGRTRPKQFTPQTKRGVIMKSNVPVNLNISLYPEVTLLPPEKDSQLQFLCHESSHEDISSKKNINPNQNQNIISESNQLNEPMEIDETLPSVVSVTSKCQQNEACTSKTITKENIKTNITEQENFPRASPETVRLPDMPNVNLLESHIGIGKFNKSDDSEISDYENDKNTNHEVQKNDNIAEDVISISSHESESKNVSHENKSYKRANNEDSAVEKNKSRINKVESNTDSESSSMYEPSKKIFVKERSISSSESSSLIKSPLKKKRTHSESSNDDDVSSIIDKWCDATEPANKKQKTDSKNKNSKPVQRDYKSKYSEDVISDEIDTTLVNETVKAPKISGPKRDPPIDDIIKKVKSFKENEASTSKMTGMPSSLLSADLFESNEHNLQSNIQALPQQIQETADGASSVSTWSPNKTSDKENVTESENVSDLTLTEFLIFKRKKSIESECSDGSNKENNVCNEVTHTTPTKVTNNTENQVDEVQGFPNERSKVYNVADTLINITQEQLAIKKFEKALGLDVSAIGNDKNEETVEDNKCTTPKKDKHSHIDYNEDDFDSDNIGATPVTKRRQIYNFSTTKSTIKTEANISDIITPNKNLNLIPAVTPMKNTTSFPLCHSTPMINTSIKEQSSSRTKKISFICSGLKPENIELVKSFVKKFNASFQNNFNMDVTHVIVQTDPETKAGQKTFKYIQGIAYKKYVVNFQWIMDCLKANELINEDNEKYEVLDPEVLESGSKRSREREKNLFDDFAFLCYEPFQSFSLNEFKSLLIYNGAVVVPSVEELRLQKDKYRIVILESENLSQKQLFTLKKSQGALVSFEWIIDSISQYHVLSLLSYLYETKPEEALALGFPPEFFIEEETLEEEEEEEEEEEL